MTIERSAEARSKAVQIARLFVGVVERTGNNDGPLIELFQRAVDGRAWGEPYCVGFLHFLCHQVDVEMGQLYPETWRSHSLKHTESAVALLQDVPAEQVVQEPILGGIVVWRYWERVQNDQGKEAWVPTQKGHAGIVTLPTQVDGFFRTIEANTSAPSGLEVVREGDGIWPKRRSTSRSDESMRYLGCFDPWR